MVKTTCIRLFEFRRQQARAPQIVAGDRWNTLYTEAADGIDILPTVDDAISWVNEFVERIAKS